MSKDVDLRALINAASFVDWQRESIATGGSRLESTVLLVIGGSFMWNGLANASSATGLVTRRLWGRTSNARKATGLQLVSKNKSLLPVLFLLDGIHTMPGERFP